MSPVDRNRWGVVVAYAALGAATQVLWLTFAPITTATAEHYGVSEGAVGWLAEVFPLLYSELATIGDPLMDLGSSLAYWVQADDGLAGRLFRRQPSHLPGMPTRVEIVARYGERTGHSTDAWAFYEVFGLFRLAVIAQQIYCRYHQRETRNPAFRRFWVAAHVLERRCRRAIRTAPA